MKIGPEGFPEGTYVCTSNGKDGSALCWTTSEIHQVLEELTKSAQPAQPKTKERSRSSKS
jgi:hypothetical protein